MDAIVLFSHGSLLCGSGMALKQHAARLRERGLAPIVEIGYLNYSEPPFAEAVERCRAAGATRIIVTPYFLVPGYFVDVSLPACIDAARQAHPHLLFTAAEPIGYDERLADALLASAQNAVGHAHWRDDLKSAPQYCTANDQCPLFGTPDCPKQPVPVPSEQNAPESPAREQDHLPFPARFLPGTPGYEANQGEGPHRNELLRSPAERGRPHAGGGIRREGLGVRERALLVMVHGSPKATANAAMFRVIDLLRERQALSIVLAGFMECNSPTIPEAIDICVGAGATEIVAVPYFLHTGTHVADDLPALLEKAQVRYAQVAFRMGPYLGHSPELTDILADRAESAMHSHE